MTWLGLAALVLTPLSIAVSVAIVLEFLHEKKDDDQPDAVVPFTRPKKDGA